MWAMDNHIDKQGKKNMLPMYLDMGQYDYEQVKDINDSFWTC